MAKGTNEPDFDYDALKVACAAARAEIVSLIALIQDLKSALRDAKR